MKISELDGGLYTGGERSREYARIGFVKHPHNAASERYRGSRWLMDNVLLKVFSHSKLVLIDKDLLESIEIILFVKNQHGFLIIN